MTRGNIFPFFIDNFFPFVGLNVVLFTYMVTSFEAKKSITNSMLLSPFFIFIPKLNSQTPPLGYRIRGNLLIILWEKDFFILLSDPR